jgi:hypothetical protein
MLAVDTAQEQLCDVRMHDVTPASCGTRCRPRPTLLIDTNDLYVPPVGVVLHSILGPGNPELWVRDRELPEALAAYRTSDGTTWPDVVCHIQHELTNAMGAESPGMWWEPRDDCGGDDFYFAKLPTPEDVTAIQTERPRHLAAYLADRDAPPFAGLWHAQPVPYPTMSVAGVAITASLADDGVFTANSDPATGVSTRRSLA